MFKHHGLSVRVDNSAMLTEASVEERGSPVTHATPTPTQRPLSTALGSATQVDVDDDDDEMSTLSQRLIQLRLREDRAKRVTVSSQQQRLVTPSEHAQCRRLYVRACRQLRIPPLSRFLKQVGNSKVSLDGEGAGRRGVKAVCSALMALSDVRSVDLSDNLLDDYCVSYVTKLLSANIYITELILANNNMTGIRTAQVAQMMQKCRTLRRIDLSGNRLSDDDAVHIAGIIKNCLEVVELKLSHNALREKGGMWIGEALGANDTIESLDLSWNHLRGRGAECVALGLKRNSTLTSLDVSWNGFGYEGSAALGVALLTNTGLTSLNVSHNRIHPPALMQLLPGLAENSSLLSLTLGPNPITANTASSVLGTLLLNKKSPLIMLDMSSIVVDKEFDVILADLQDSRPDFLCNYEKAIPLHRRQWEIRRRTLIEMKNKIFNVDPLRILWHTKRNLRTVDLFNKIDKDKNYRLSRGEIRQILEKENFFLSTSALDDIMEYLDANGDGEIDMSEFVDGERRYKRATLEEGRTIINRSRLGVEGAMPGVPLDAGGVGGRFSETYRPDNVLLPPRTPDLSKRLAPKRVPVKLPPIGGNLKAPEGQRSK